MSKEDNAACSERKVRQKCREQRIREDRGERENPCIQEVNVCRQDIRQGCEAEVLQVKDPVKRFPQTLTFQEHSSEFKQVIRNGRIGLAAALTTLLVGGKVYHQLVVKPRTEEALKRYQREESDPSPLQVEDISSRLTPGSPVAFRGSINLDVVEDMSREGEVREKE